MASRFRSRKSETTNTNKRKSARRPKYTATNADKAKERGKEKRRRRRERQRARRTENRDSGLNVRIVAANQEQPIVQDAIGSRKRRRIANDDTLRTIPPEAVTIYTDGACADNGKVGAKAGYGVFFGANDSRNVSARVPGKQQTNQRGELFAVLKALEIIHLDHGRYLGHQVFILSDSMYALNALTIWGQSWERNQWVKSTGETVISKDIISRARELLRLLENQGVRVQFNHVRSHAGLWGNEQADELARKGATMLKVIEWVWDNEFDDNELENELMESLEYEDEELDEIIAEWDS